MLRTTNLARDQTSGREGEIVTREILDVVAEYFGPYLTPVLFVFVAVLLADRLLDLFYDALYLRGRRR